MAKNPNRAGTISKRIKDGKVIGWRGGVTVGYDAQGHQIRKWVSGKTQAEVVDKLRMLQAEISVGNILNERDIDTTQHLDDWIQHKENRGIKANTLRSYRDTSRLYLKPHLGHKKLSKLRPIDIENLVATLRREGKSPALIQYVLRILRMALAQAVRWERMNRNVAEGVEGPEKEDRDFHLWTLEQSLLFLKTVKNHRLYALFHLALTTGMRRGELLGLKHQDVDWQRNRLLVRNNLVENRLAGIEGKLHRGQQTVSATQVVLQTPKTKKSKRIVTLSPTTIEALKEHLQKQQQEREYLVSDWQDEGFLFTNEVGEPILPRTLYGWFKDLTREAGLPEIRFHDLRHTAASLMIQRGLPPKVVSDRLGHKDVAFTMRVYAHLYDEQREEAAFDLEDMQPEGEQEEPE